MFNSNNICSVSALDECQQTLDVVGDKVTFLSSKFRKWVEKSLNGAKNIKFKLKKKFHFFARDNACLPCLWFRRGFLKMVVDLV